MLTTVLLFQEIVVKHPLFLKRFHIGFLIFTIVFIGYYRLAQLSVVNVLTFAQLLMHEFNWQTFNATHAWVSTMSDGVIQLDHVQLNYGKFRALSDINLHVPEGDVVELLGYNGAGKTTIMKLLLGLLKANAGSVSVFGGDPLCTEHANKIRNKTGYLPENLSFYPQLTGLETLSYFAALKGADKK